MSEWFEIKDQDDVDLSEDGKRIEILIGYNEFGNQYIEVPIKFITRVLKEGHENDCFIAKDSGSDL